MTPIFFLRLCVLHLSEPGERSFGGAVLSVGGTLRIVDSNLTDNWSECSNVYGTGCGSHGGAASVAQLGTLELRSCRVQRNAANCSVARGCTDGSGGAGDSSDKCFLDPQAAFDTVYGDSGSTTVGDCVVDENTATGYGGGGAVAAVGGRVAVVSTSIANNTAHEGVWE